MTRPIIERIDERLVELEMTRRKASLLATANKNPDLIRNLDREEAKALSAMNTVNLARVLGVNVAWLEREEGPKLPDDKETQMVPVVGYVGAGAEIHIVDDPIEGARLDEAELLPGMSPQTVAVRIRGDSMHGVASDGWLVYYDDRREPVTEDMIGQLCVVGLSDGKVLLKFLYLGRAPGLFDLESANAPIMRDQPVEWAARVTAIIPRPAPVRALRSHHIKRLPPPVAAE